MTDDILFLLIGLGVLLALIGLFIVSIWLLMKSYRAAVQRAQSQLGLPSFQELRPLLKDEPGQRPYWQDLSIPILSFLAGAIPLYLIESQSLSRGDSVSWSHFIPGGIISWSLLGLISVGTKLSDVIRIRGRTVCTMGQRPFESRAFEQAIGGILLLCPTVLFGCDLFIFHNGDPLVSLMFCLVFGTVSLCFIARAPFDRLTQFGFFSRGNLYPWNTIMCYLWTENRKALIVVHEVRLYFQGVFFLSVPPEHRELVDRWLKEKIPDAERPPYRHPLLVEAEEQEQTLSPAPEQV